MTKAEMVALLRSDVAAWNHWRRENPEIEIDLYGADLAGANLAGATLAEANLAGATLAGANLVDADLYGADLHGADLADANLAGATLANADLEKTVLDPANSPNGDVDGFERDGDGDYVIAWRNAHSTCVRNTQYKPGREYVAPVFSTANTECHPGLYLWPTRNAARAWGEKYDCCDIIRVRALAADVHHAGNKWRCKRFAVMDNQEKEVRYNMNWIIYPIRTKTKKGKLRDCQSCHGKIRGGQKYFDAGKHCAHYNCIVKDISANDEVCANCQFWSQLSGKDDIAINEHHAKFFGWCSCPNLGEEAAGIYDLLLYDKSYCHGVEFATGRLFACRHFREKENE